MTSPARRHQLRVHAQLAALAAPAGGQVEGSAYELMLAQLYEHRRTLKTMQSIERKIEAKRTMLADFDAWVDGALAAGQGGHDLVLTSVMVWHLDCGHWARGLQIAAYVLHHQLPLPDQYNRDTATLLIDESATAALAGTLLGREAVQVLSQVEQMTAERDVPDQARAKLHKAIGYALMGKTPITEPDITTLDPALARQAMTQLERAYQLFTQVGVKKDLERLERRLKAASNPD